MDALEFQKNFLEEIKSTATIIGEGSSSAFTNIMTEYLINSEVITEFNPSFYNGTGSHNRSVRVDGYCIDDFDNTFNLFIADYTGNQDRERIIKSYIKNIFVRLKNFVDDIYNYPTLKSKIEESTPVYDLVEQLLSNKERIRKFRLFYLTDGFTSDRITELESDSINSVPTEYQIWDVGRLYNVCYSDLGRQEIEIDFRAYSSHGISCLEASATNTEEYNSYLCIIPGEILADVYDEYGSSLLEGNVRSFLSTKVAVNKKIRSTIMSCPERFFAYNNGISATAKDLKFEVDEKGKYLVYAKDFQIVNGGQTTASLSSARFKEKADLSKVYVQMKLTEVDSDADKSTELIRNISRSSNSQNKVSEADFFSTHPFHVRIEQISNRLYAPAVGGAQYETKWFYERARGQYIQAQMRMTKAEKNKFTAQHPKKQVITKTDLAKVRNTWNRNPQIVSKGAQTNFLKFADVINEAWDISDSQFNETYYKETVALMILFKYTESLVSHQSWYENGYRANIVTYSIALLHELILKQYPDQDIDLMMIWNKQSIPQSIEEQLINISKYVNSRITDDSRPTANVTQWCKRDDCWKDIKKNCDIELTPSIKKVLISNDEIKKERKDAQKDQRIVSDMEAQAKVIEYGADFWKKAYGFTITKKIATPSIIIAIKVAMAIPAKIPNPVQSKALLEHLDLIQQNGFKI